MAIGQNIQFKLMLSSCVLNMISYMYTLTGCDYYQ